MHERFHFLSHNFHPPVDSEVPPSIKIAHAFMHTTPKIHKMNYSEISISDLQKLFRQYAMSRDILSVGEYRLILVSCSFENKWKNIIAGSTFYWRQSHAIGGSALSAHSPRPLTPSYQVIPDTTKGTPLQQNSLAPAASHRPSLPMQQSQPPKPVIPKPIAHQPAAPQIPAPQ